jgi:hypothetical protein
MNYMRITWNHTWSLTLSCYPPPQGVSLQLRIWHELRDLAQTGQENQDRAFPRILRWSWHLMTQAEALGLWDEKDQSWTK